MKDANTESLNEVVSKFQTNRGTYDFILPLNTLFADQPKILKENMQDAIRPSVNNLAGSDPTLNRDLSEEFDLEELVDEVKINYLKKAVKLSHGNIGEASEILGYKNYQTLQYALEKYNIEY